MKGSILYYTMPYHIYTIGVLESRIGGSILWILRGLQAAKFCESVRSPGLHLRGAGRSLPNSGGLRNSGPLAFLFGAPLSSTSGLYVYRISIVGDEAFLMKLRLTVVICAGNAGRATAPVWKTLSRIRFVQQGRWHL